MKRIQSNIKHIVVHTTFLGNFKSKRFLAACGATVLFTFMVYTTTWSPIEIATAIGIILGVYTGVETWRPSQVGDDHQKPTG